MFHTSGGTSSGPRVLWRVARRAAPRADVDVAVVDGGGWPVVAVRVVGVPVGRGGGLVGGVAHAGEEGSAGGARSAGGGVAAGCVGGGVAADGPGAVEGPAGGGGGVVGGAGSGGCPVLEKCLM